MAEAPKRSELELAKAGTTLKQMEATGFHLFPLRKWNAEREDPKTGKMLKVGKMPRDVGYQTHDYVMNWARYLKGGSNVGVLAGPDDIIMDIDPERGGLESFERLCWDVDDDFSSYPRSMSGKGDGGFHVFMKKPMGLICHWQMAAFRGIDFQGFLRYVVAPGSLHPKTGKPYALTAPWHAPTMAPARLIGILAKPPRVSSGGLSGALTFDDIRQMLDVLDPRDFGAGGKHHEEWLNIAMAVHHGAGGDDEAKDIWLAWCAGDEQYGDEASDMNERRWDSFDASSGSDAITYKTLLQAVARAGHARLVARLHAAGADMDFEDDDEAGDEALLARVGASAKTVATLKRSK